MTDPNSLYQRIPADVLILMCLFLGATARLARNEQISVWVAAKEFYYSLIVGAVITGFFIWLSEWELKSGWWLALGAPIFCSLVVEIIEKKAHDIRDMDLKETIVFIFDEIKKRLTKTPTP